LEKVEAPKGLVALPMSIGGRAAASPGGSQAGFGKEEYTSQWPGTYFETAFAGRELFFRVGASHEILHVVVDGKPPLILTNPASGVYRLSGLSRKGHSVRILVATESQDAPNAFGGFGIPANEKALEITRRARQIEFIGDSYTVGYGNTSAKQECTSDEVWATTDDTQAFGPWTAAHYDADYQVNAISGRGMVRNYGGSGGDTLPEAYPYALFDKKQVYADPNWKPEILVIGLGTNDFSTPVHPGEKWKSEDELRNDYEASYVRFLKRLRARNPDAYFVLWGTELIDDEVKRVADEARAEGETRISFLAIDHLSFKGCHWHPSLADDRTIRDKLVEVIDSTSGIWQGK